MTSNTYHSHLVYNVGRYNASVDILIQSNSGRNNIETVKVGFPMLQTTDTRANSHCFPSYFGIFNRCGLYSDRRSMRRALGASSAPAQPPKDGISYIGTVLRRGRQVDVDMGPDLSTFVYFCD